MSASCAPKIINLSTKNLRRFYTAIATEKDVTSLLSVVQSTVIIETPPTHTCRSLNTLVLTENRFGDKGAQSLISTLHRNSSLTVLTVDASLINQESRGDMVRLMLEKNKELLRYKTMVKTLEDEVEKLTKERDHYCEQLKQK